MSEVFVSYCQQDEDRVRPLVAALELAGLSVFWDRKIAPGRTWRDCIGIALSQAKCVVVVWSHDAIKSNWVVEEAEEGKARMILVPVRLDSVLPPLGFRSIQVADLSKWKGDNTSAVLKELLDNVLAVTGHPQEARVEEVTPSASILRRGQKWHKNIKPSNVALGIVTLCAGTASSLFYFLKQPALHKPIGVESHRPNIPKPIAAERRSFSLERFKALRDYAYSRDGLDMTEADATSWADARLRENPNFDLAQFKELVNYAYATDGLNLTKEESVAWALDKVKR
jgi:hypothetical protein